MKILDDFLAAHPEHVCGVRLFDTPEGPQPYLDPEALLAFTAWVVTAAGCDPVLVRLMWAAMQSQNPDAFVGPPPV